MIEKLDFNELRAVLNHEAYHLRVYEPLRLFWVKLTVKGLFFLPGIKFLYKNYLVLSELAADELATVGSKQKIFLARALDKIIQFKLQEALKEKLAISFFNIMEERVNNLAGNWQAPMSLSLSLRFLAALIVLMIGFFSFNLTSELAEASIIKHNNFGIKCSVLDESLSKGCQKCLFSEDYYMMEWWQNKNCQSCH